MARLRFGPRDAEGEWTDTHVELPGDEAEPDDEPDEEDPPLILPEGGAPPPPESPPKRPTALTSMRLPTDMP